MQATSLDNTDKLNAITDQYVATDLIKTATIHGCRTGIVFVRNTWACSHCTPFPCTVMWHPTMSGASFGRGAWSWYQALLGAGGVRALKKPFRLLPTFKQSSKPTGDMLLMSCNTLLKLWATSK